MGLLLVAATHAFLVPRRRRPLPVDPDGAVAIRSNWVVVWATLLAGLSIYPVGGLWLLLLLTDPGGTTFPAGLLALLVAAVGLLPDLVRLLRGRLYRWELRLDDEGYRYRGYRTDESGRWSQVHGARIVTGKDAGVLIDRKGTGPDRLVPLAAFDVPAEQILEEIEQRLHGRTQAAG